MIMWINEIIFLHLGIYRKRRGHGKGTGYKSLGHLAKGGDPSSAPCKAPDQENKVNG